MVDNIKLKKITRKLTATRVIVMGFFAIIFIGAGLLCIPAATKGEGISFLNALFTATSATCVTGLTVFNIFDTFTVFGQVVILLLIQVGGIGFMSVSSFLYLAISKKISLSMRLAMQEEVASGDVKHISTYVKRILLFTLFCETIGAVILIGAFSEYMGAGEAIWNGIFHSISAFCNSGFDIVGISADSMSAFNSNPLVLVTLSFLIILGGLGFIVVSDVFDIKKKRHLQLHSKIVLAMSAVLILFGTAIFLGVEYNNPDTLGNMSFGDKLLNAYFQSVSARTAGFSSVDISSLQPSSQLTLEMLMFIGASPASTGGGIKTTTLFILFATVYSVVRQRKYAVVDKQTISAKTIHRAASVLAMAIIIMVASTFALMLTDGATFSSAELVFEQISAYATVGLSMGATSGLSIGGRIIIMLNMFLGRVGVLTFFIAFTKGRYANEGKIVYPECSINI